MPTLRPPRPPYPPSGGDADESDESLGAALRGRPDRAGTQALALLMARHWKPAHEYAVICVASPGGTASMVTAAAFHQVLDRITVGENAAALRPRLLLAVRDTVRRWAAEERTSAVLPDLGKPAGARGMRVTRAVTAENRRLAERSFHALPGPARCLLWHVEVEAEPVQVPAGLLGMDTDSALAALEQAREKFREGCLRAHRELAPTQDCRFHNRLLDVPIRRGGTLLPDVRRHLGECRHCRDAAEQLGRCESGLDVLLAEAVLGWGARRYLDTRPGRAGQAGPRTRSTARHGAARRRLLPGIPVPPTPRGGPRLTRTLLTGVGATSAGLLAMALLAGVWSDEGRVDPAASTTTGGPGAAPGTGSPTSPSASSDAAQLPTAPARTRLRNAEAGLCLDIRGAVKAGAGTGLAACSAAVTQQWSYGSDGLLRSVADSALCLDSHKDSGVVILGTCAGAQAKRADDVRYGRTGRGELLPRWDERLALAATTGDPGADIVVTVRDGSGTQRWLADPASRATPGSPLATGTENPPARGAEPPSDRYVA